MYALVIHVCTVFNVPILDVGILKHGFSNQQIMWSTAANSKSGNQQNRACETVEESWEQCKLKKQTVSDPYSNNKNIIRSG